MVCYIIPSVLALTLFAFRKLNCIKSTALYLLNLLLAGGAIMLVIDHLWNNELFLISENIISDLTLGLLMTLGVIVFLGLIIAMEKKHELTNFTQLKT